MRRFRRIAVIGVGLIGGSLALALRRAGAVDEVVGCGRDESHLVRAVDLGVIDRYSLDPARAAAGADLVFVATPVGTMETVFRAIAPALAEHAIVTDGGSVKGSVVEAARAAFGTLPARFVPGHPIAGSERSGVEAAFAELFDHRRVILTPTDETDAEAVAAVERLWQCAGALVSRMSPAQHDRVLAATSHLPHVVAYAVVERLAEMDGREETLAYGGTGFRDFTRIAASNPAMWVDIVLANRDALGALLDDLMTALAQVRADIERGDAQSLQTRFARARAARERFAVLAQARAGADNGGFGESSSDE